MEGVKDGTLRGFSDTRIEELMDSRTFKASRSRRVNDIEFRINVCPSPRPASASQGVLARVMTRGSKKRECSIPIYWQIGPGNTLYGSAIAKLKPKPVPEVENPGGNREKMGPKGGSKANRSHEINDLT